MKNRNLVLFDGKLIENINKIPMAASQGFNSILLPPLQLSKEEWNNDWRMKYQIVNLKIGNKTGSKEDLIAFCNECHKYGLETYVDVVVTHFGNQGGGELLYTPH